MFVNFIFIDVCKTSEYWRKLALNSILFIKFQFWKEARNVFYFVFQKYLHMPFGFKMEALNFPLKQYIFFLRKFYLEKYISLC